MVSPGSVLAHVEGVFLKKLISAITKGQDDQTEEVGTGIFFQQRSPCLMLFTGQLLCLYRRNPRHKKTLMKSKLHFRDRRTIRVVTSFQRSRLEVLESDEEAMRTRDFLEEEEAMIKEDKDTTT